MDATLSSLALVALISVALIFDFLNGLHDAANSIATVVSTRVLRPQYAVMWAAFFNFIAFLFFGLHVAQTVGTGIVAADAVDAAVIFGALMGAICWNLLTWWFGIPSSSSHTLIGGFAGAGIAHAGSFAAIEADPVIKTASFIFLAPLVGMIMAFIISLWFIHSFKKGIAPKLISVVVIACVIVFLYYSLEFDPAKLKSHYESYILKVIFFSKNFKWILLGLILIIIAIFTLYLNNLNANRANKWFKRLQLVSSAAFSIGHGGNDAQKVMGIITAALIANGTIEKFEQMPIWVPLACYTA